ncbi:hypothetical protein [Anditalea andensis]|uniref:Uncharacterized protein n=1 Tax=Anditalea andensis TaxID=1048983 RepID=A0A074KY23_9BACT|nr:hypothetical protein [Anditalea andensis]KEO74881.1 hypothetical protein EL17_04165 [Anditalea andensis]
MSYDLESFYKKEDEFTVDDYSKRSKKTKEEAQKEFDAWVREKRIAPSERTTDKINNEGPFFKFF